MTANQIAYANQLENERHNQAFEAETQRHNIAMERIQDDANAIAKERNQLDATYKSQTVELQKEYNNWYARFTEANEKEKNRIASQGNLIKQKMNDVQEAYNIASNDLRAQENSIKKQLADETKRWNDIQRELKDMQLSTEYWYRSMENDYRNRQLDEQSTYWRGLLGLQAYQSEQKDTELALNASQLTWDILKFPKQQEMTERGQDLDFVGDLGKSFSSFASALLKVLR